MARDREAVTDKERGKEGGDEGWGGGGSENGEEKETQLQRIG